MIHIALPFNTINTSAQVGDLIFYAPNINAIGGFEYSLNQSLLFFGPIVSINEGFIEVLYDNNNNPNAIPTIDAYIMFAKDKKINNNDLKGYYLEAQFENNSKDKIELFAVGSQVSQSSK